MRDYMHPVDETDQTVATASIDAAIGAVLRCLPSNTGCIH